MRWSEPGARTTGISVVQMKVIVGALAALVAGIGGGFLAVAQTSVQPTEFATFAGVVWLAVLVTIGVRSITAALLAGLALVLLPTLVQAYLPGVDGQPAPGPVRSGRHRRGQVPRGDPGRAGPPPALAARQPGGRPGEHRADRHRAPGRGRPGHPRGPRHRRPHRRRHRGRGEQPAVSGTVPVDPVAPSSGVPSPGDPTPALAALDVTSGSGASRPLDSVSLLWRQRSIAGLVGPNGAGKTTMLGVLSGLRRPDAGRVLLGGVEVTTPAPRPGPAWGWPAPSSSPSCSSA